MPKILNEDRYLWLREQTKINDLDLNGEVSKMPTLVLEAGDGVAFAVNARDLAKIELDYVTAVAQDAMRSEMDYDISGKPTKYKSETRITSELPLQKEVQRVTGLLEDAKLSLGLWSSLAESMSKKSSALTRLVDMALAGYTATNSYASTSRKQDDAAYVATRAELAQRHQARVAAPIPRAAQRRA